MDKSDGKDKDPGVVEVATIRILFCPATNELQVHGPMDNGVLFCGMLQMAYVSFLEHRARRAAQSIVQAPPGLRL
jgi:hypothetical protein